VSSQKGMAPTCHQPELPVPFVINNIDGSSAGDIKWQEFIGIGIGSSVHLPSHKLRQTKFPAQHLFADTILLKERFRKGDAVALIVDYQGNSHPIRPIGDLFVHRHINVCDCLCITEARDLPAVAAIPVANSGGFNCETALRPGRMRPETYSQRNNCEYVRARSVPAKHIATILALIHETDGPSAVLLHCLFRAP
jgi:hypothetical protein